MFDKVRFFWDVQTGIYSAYSSPQATGLVLFGLLFGVNGAMTLKVVKSGALRHIPNKSGGASFMFVVLSGGCIACRTSILARNSRCDVVYFYKRVKQLAQLDQYHTY